MTKLDTAKRLADSYLSEIDATIEIRQSYTTIVVGMAGRLLGALGADGAAKTTVQQALKHKAVDPSAVYKPLIVQVNGVFEHYIRGLTEAIVTERFEKIENYNDLDQGFRNEYITHAARVLVHVKAGSVMGAAYNFDNLLKNLGRGLSGQIGYRLNAEIYTKLMGNCTAERLEKLFSALSLPEPFSEALGQNTQLRSYFADKAKGRVGDRARGRLDKELNLRNEIVHGDLTRAVDVTELKDTLAFFRALISSLDQLVRT